MSSLFASIGFSSMVFALTLDAGNTNRQEHPFEWINAEAAFVVAVSDVPSLATYLREMELWDDPHFVRACEVMSHEEFPLLHRTRLEKLRELGEELLQELRHLQELVFIVHSAEPTDPQITIMIKGSAEDLEKIQGVLFGIGEVIREPTEPLDDDFAAEAMASGTFAASNIGGWLLFSNSAPHLDEIISRHSGQTHRIESVAQSRRFRIATSHLTRYSAAAGGVLALGNPSKLRHFFPEITDERWKAMQINELPSFGFQAFFVPLSAEESLTPRIFFEAVVTFTFPRTGLGQYAAAYRSIGQLPPFAFDAIHYFEAEAYDPVDRHIAMKALHEAENPDDDYDHVVQRSHDRSGLNYAQDIQPRYDARFSYSVAPLHSEDGRMWALILQRINDSEAAARYALNLIDQVNAVRGGNNPIGSIDNPHGSLFAANANTDHPGYVQGRASFNSYYFDGNWYMQGVLAAIRRQLSVMYEGRESVRSQLSEMVTDLQRRGRSIGEPFRIVAYSPDYWRARANIIQALRVGEKLRETASENWTADQLEPDELGVALKIESQEDVEAVVSMLLGNAFAKQFGGQALHFYHDQNRVQVVGGIYPDWKPNE